MSESTVEACRRGYDDYDEGRMDEVYEALDPEIAFDHLGAFLQPQQIKSLADYKGFMRQIEETYEVFEIEEREYFEASDDKVLLTATLRTVERESGESKSQHIAWLWTFRDGKFFRATEYLDADAAKQEHGVV